MKTEANVKEMENKVCIFCSPFFISSTIHVSLQNAILGSRVNQETP